MRDVIGHATTELAHLERQRFADRFAAADQMCADPLGAAHFLK